MTLVIEDRATRGTEAGGPQAKRSGGVSEANVRADTISTLPWTKAHAEIISADSVQVYKYMDIGSAKITSEEMSGVQHHMIDIMDPFDEFNVVIFKEKITVNNLIGIVLVTLSGVLINF